MKTSVKTVRLILALGALASITSCSLLHNENDWAMHKGSSATYTPKQIGKPELGEPVRGGN